MSKENGIYGQLLRSKAGRDCMMISFIMEVTSKDSPVYKDIEETQGILAGISQNHDLSSLYDKSPKDALIQARVNMVMNQMSHDISSVFDAFSPTKTEAIGKNVAIVNSVRNMFVNDFDITEVEAGSIITFINADGHIARAKKTGDDKLTANGQEIRIMPGSNGTVKVKGIRGSEVYQDAAMWLHNQAPEPELKPEGDNGMEM